MKNKLSDLFLIFVVRIRSTTFPGRSCCYENENIHESNNCYLGFENNLIISLPNLFLKVFKQVGHIFSKKSSHVVSFFRI